MSEAIIENVVDDPAASKRVLAFVRFSTPYEMVEAIQWLLASPHLADQQGTRPKVALRLEAAGSGGFAKLMHFRREIPDELRRNPMAVHSTMAIVLSDLPD